MKVLIVIGYQCYTVILEISIYESLSYGGNKTRGY